MNVFVFMCLCFLSRRLVWAEEVTTDDFTRIDETVQEALCDDAGGFCTVAEDCPPGHLSENRGLCPEQKASGIECCFGLSLKETRCAKHSGICVPATRFCHVRQIFVEASDCPDDTRCCVMMQ